MTTCRDLINETQRLLGPTQRSVTVTLSSNYTAGGTSLSFTDNSTGTVNTAAILPGTILSVDLELFYVTAAPSNGTVSVSGGYLGSTNANHSSGALVYVNRKFTDFECFQQINHTLDDLTGLGLYNTASLDITFNPAIQAYDLAGVSGFVEIIALRYKTPLPDRKFRAIPDSRWELIPAMTDSNFPSTYALVLNDMAWPGQPIHVIYRQNFVYFTSYTDDAQSKALLGITMNDIPPMGAMLRMVTSREIARNQIQAQPDSRLAPEVPPGAIANSVAGIHQIYLTRIQTEQQRLKRSFAHLRRRF